MKASYNDSISSCSSMPRPIFPKHLFPTEYESSSSYCAFDSTSQSSSCFAIFPQKTQIFNGGQNAKSLNFANAMPRISNIPTAIKENSNQETTNRRNTLKLKSDATPDPERRVGSSSNPVAPNTLKRRTVEENNPNSQGINVRKNSENLPKTVKTVSFLKVEGGKIVGTRNFRCFLEQELCLPLNLNKFIQSTETDDDVETDDETLEYYIHKVRKQLEEAVEIEKEKKRRKKEKKNESKENVHKITINPSETAHLSHFNRENLEKRIDAPTAANQTLKLVCNK